MGWRRRLQAERGAIYPEDFSSPTAHEERMSALYHQGASHSERRGKLAGIAAGACALEAIVASPYILDIPVLCSLGLVGMAPGGVATWHYRSIGQIERFTAEQGPQPPAEY